MARDIEARPPALVVSPSGPAWGGMGSGCFAGQGLLQASGQRAKAFPSDLEQLHVHRCLVREDSGQGCERRQRPPSCWDPLGTGPVQLDNLSLGSPRCDPQFSRRAAHYQRPRGAREQETAGTSRHCSPRSGQDGGEAVAPDTEPTAAPWLPPPPSSVSP